MFKGCGGDSFGRSTSILGGLRRFWGSCRRATVLAPLHINKMDTSTGGPSQQPGPTPAALVLARSGGMPRVGALRLAASSAPTRIVPQRAIAARQEEEQSRLAIGPGNRIRPVGVADSSNTRVEVAAPRGAVMQHHSLRGMEHRRQPESWLFRMQVRRHLRRCLCRCERSAVRHRRPPNGAQCRSCGRSGGCVGIAETLSTATRPLPAADVGRASGR